MVKNILGAIMPPLPMSNRVNPYSTRKLVNVVQWNRRWRCCGCSENYAICHVGVLALLWKHNVTEHFRVKWHYDKLGTDLQILRYKLFLSRPGWSTLDQSPSCPDRKPLNQGTVGYTCDCIIRFVFTIP